MDKSEKLNLTLKAVLISLLINLLILIIIMVCASSYNKKQTKKIMDTEKANQEKVLDNSSNIYEDMEEYLDARLGK